MTQFFYIDNFYIVSSDRPSFNIRMDILLAERVYTTKRIRNPYFISHVVELQFECF